MLQMFWNNKLVIKIFGISIIRMYFSKLSHDFTSQSITILISFLIINAPVVYKFSILLLKPKLQLMFL